VVYLLVAWAFSKGVSFFSQSNLVDFLFQNWFLLLLFPFVSYSIYKFKSYAKYYLLIYLSIVLVSSFVLLSSSFNKLVLALDFAYALFAFYFYTAWEIERAHAAYNPLFFSNDLEKESRFPIKGVVYSSDRSTQSKVSLTNLDEHTCFVLLDQTAFDFPNGILEINFDNVLFSSSVKLIARYDRALGFVFSSKNKSSWSLSELCKICRQRGLFLHS
jgi:hypothetical protein